MSNHQPSIGAVCQRSLNGVRGALALEVSRDRCAALFKARFDERLDCWPVADLGGEEGCAADPLGGGSGERHVQRMPESGRRGPLTSAYSERVS